MALVREEHQIVRLAGADQRVNEAGRVAEVDVLVDQPVLDEQRTAQPAGFRAQRRAPVAVGVRLGQAEVALGVVRVVQALVRVGRTGDGGIGRDWALISVKPEWQSLVTPTMAFWGSRKNINS
mgnify:CR=1 FL=1